MQRLGRTLAELSVAALLAATAGSGLAAQADAKKPAPPPPQKKDVAVSTAKPVMIGASDIKWGPAPPGMPAGMEAAVLDGDPGKPGLFTIRVKAPDGYMVPPHWHGADEHITVFSGTLMMGTGAKWDDSALHEMSAGSYGRMPRRTNHFVKMKGETTFQVSGMGPFSITYVDPKDDPRKKTSSN
jgi:hypothetical protein